ncbi:MAG: carcinine hydrolase/isopenicillin-N N-acyltransferase family protein [Ruminococcus sp.]
MKKSGKTKKIIKITALSLAAVILVSLITAGVVLSGRIASMMSIRRVGDDLYTVNYQQDYHLDKALNAEIKNENELLRFICDDMFFGYRIEGNLQKYGCSAFLTPTPDGKYLAGRNFGLGGSDTLCLYTHPQGGYAAVATVSTDMIAVGQGNEYETESLWGRAALLAAPYMGVDGMNEKGLTASLLDVDYGEEHMHTDNPDLTVTMAIRLLLDRAATVEEAVELLRGYDIHTGHGWTQHIFVADANGDAAVIEWHNEKMRVTESPVCTNFRLSDKTFEGNYKGACDRFDLLDKALKEQPENTAEDSMKLLEDVRQEFTEYNIFTEWSVVFHLSDFTVNYAVNMDYGTVYHLDPRAF